MRHRGRASAVVIAILATVMAFLAPTLPADAAGSGVLGVAVAAVDSAGAPLTSVSSNGTYVAGGGDVAIVGYRVTYSCSAAACAGASVALTPPQTDPQGFGKQLLAYDSWTAPFTGATIAGTDAAGETISLGDLAAGASGSFTVYYAIQPVAPHGTTIAPAEYFPDGFPIATTATISSSTATASVSANSAPVAWHIAVPNPSIVESVADTVAPDVNVTYSVGMGSGAFVYGGSGRIVGSSAAQAAGSYVVVDQLPAEAVYVSSTYGGVYDATAHTVTWTVGSADAPDVNAAGGWGQAGGTWTTASPYYGPHTVTVQYPASNFPEADAEGCNFEASVSNTVTATLTYLDPAHTVKTVSTPAGQGDTLVQCYEPFGRATMSKSASGDVNSGSVGVTMDNVPPDTTGVICPSTGVDSWGRACTAGQQVPAYGEHDLYWNVSTRNAGNQPGVATVTDDQLDLPGAPVYEIYSSSTTPAPTVNWTYQCGTDAPVSGTTVSRDVKLTTAQRSAGCRYTAATVTSGTLAPGNHSPDDTNAGTEFYVRFYYAVTTAAIPLIGTQVTNTASAVMSYPGTSLADVDAGSDSKTIQFRAWPTVTTLPSFTASFPAAAAVDGGGNAVPGRDVTFSVTGTTANVDADAGITPEYVFIAPAGWSIDDGSASFPAGSVPAGAQFSYSTATIGGVDRELVTVTWPSDVSFGANTTWPTLSVKAQPTFAVAAGTTSQATAWVGDARDQFDNTQASYAGAVQDTTDADGNGLSSDWFSSASQGVLVSSADGLSVVKQICQPDPTAADGCDWISNPGDTVAVAPNADDITYRVILQDTGNTTLSGVVAYDVLPYLGDTGTSAGTATTPRGSTFAETLSGTSKVSSKVQLAYSGSTNPARPEVAPGAPGAVDDWGTTAAGAQAIRATVTGTLQPGETVSFTYAATVAGVTALGSQACNSVAVASDQTLAAEPLPVCATTAQADLAITIPAHLSLQYGRPGVLPFTVSNLPGGNAQASGSVTISVPAGLTVTDFAPSGWSCSTSDDDTAPLSGPVSLDCLPVNADGTTRQLAAGSPDALDLPVVPETESGPIAVLATVTGPLFDPDGGNNLTTGEWNIAPATAGVALTKSDGVSAATAGQRLSYTLTASNLLVGEAVSGAVVTDTLPDSLVFVSASGDGALSGVAAGQAGGTVSWTLPTLAAAGQATTAGGEPSGAAGSTVELTLTVRVAPSATGDVVNTARLDAPDPAEPRARLTATADDTDQLRALSITKTSDVSAFGVTVGDTITYTVTERNRGDADFTTSSPAAIVDDLSGVLGQASFIPGSATIAIDGGAPAAVADPSGTALRWSGALAAGSTAVLSYRVVVTSGAVPVANAAYIEDPTSCVNGADANGLPCATTTDAFGPALTILKTATLADENGNGTADTGESISYRFVVTNTGGATAHDVTVHDPKVTGVSPASAVVEPGESVAFTSSAYLVTQADVDAEAPISNTAYATGLSPLDLPTTSPDSTATTPVTAAAPALALVKSGDLDDANGNGVVDAGETIAYHFVVTNTGNVTLHGVTIADAKVTGVDPASATLAPGQQQLFTAQPFVAQQSDIDAGGFVVNVATATGLDPLGGDVTSDPSEVRTPVADPAPAMTIIKRAQLHDTSGDGLAEAGETITYTFEVTNTGNMTESGVVIDDPKVSAVTPASATLYPGQTLVFTSSPYRVTQADADSGKVSNTATAHGADAAGVVTTTDPSTAVVETDPPAPVVAAAGGDPVTTILAVTGTRISPWLTAGAGALIALGLGALAARALRAKRRGLPRG
ncbi:DUF7507 domain-containing protein [Gryllotalpicola koreensis]|uniref:DUF11 domain-containing protein n=1 Tax=Gryllotalpicola koreensis TaxID=993086 RepID=A0ABP7ZP92_9MICO